MVNFPPGVPAQRALSRLQRTCPTPGQCSCSPLHEPFVGTFVAIFVETEEIDQGDDKDGDKDGMSVEGRGNAPHIT